MGIKFINACGSGIFGILLSFCFLKILGLNFFRKNDIVTLNKKPVQVSVKLKMREKGFILY